MQVALAMMLAAGAAGFGFDRVDVLSETPGTWMHYDLPQAGVYPTSTALRLVEQVSVGWRLPVQRLYLSTSLAAQTLTWEDALWAEQGLYWTGGLQTRLLLPRGVQAGLAWRVWHLRLGVSVALVSGASWAHPDWTFWRVLPTVGIGFGRRASPAPGP